MEIFVGQTAQSEEITGTHDNVSLDSQTVPLATLTAVSRNNIVNSVNNDIGHGLGMSDGVVEGAIGWGVDSAAATSDCNQVRQPTSVLSCVASSQTPDGIHDHDSFVAGGQRVARTANGFNNEWFANHMHFADCNAAVLEADLSAVINTAVNIDPGFVWNVVICFGNNIAGSVGQTSDADFSFGFYVLADNAQSCMIWNSNHGQATPGDNSMHMSSIYAAGKTVTGVGTIEYGVDISAGAGTSCDLTTRIAGGAGNRVTCLFLGFTGTEIAKIVQWDSPTATGIYAVSGQAISPIYGMIDLLSLAAAYDAAEADGDAGAYGISFSTPVRQLCLAGADENAADPSDSQSTMVDKSIDVSLDDGSEGLVAVLTQLLSGGLEYNFTATDGTVRRQTSLWIGEPATTDPEIPVINQNDPLAHNVTAEISGVNFEALQGTGSVVISPTDDVLDVGAITQTVISWSDELIQITGVVDTLNIGDTLFLFVINDSAASNAAGFTVSFDANFELDFADDLSFQVTMQFSLVPPTDAHQRFGKDGYLARHSWFFGG